MGVAAMTSPHHFPIVTALLLLATCGSAVAETARLHDLRLFDHADHTRVVFELTQAFDQRIFALEQPYRLVIDLGPAQLHGVDLNQPIDDPRVAAFRSGVREQGALRLVIDLKYPVIPNAFWLRPINNYDHRLVVDLFDPPSEVAPEPRAPKRGSPTSEPSTEHPAERESGSDRREDGDRKRLSETKRAREQASKAVSVQSELPGYRDVIIAIDAGHGGRDPGAIGVSGVTHEKEVTLAIARRLERLVDKQRGMRALMIRDGDIYIGLGQRVAIAQEGRADLFISLHADAFMRRAAHGASVYALSLDRASSEAAKWLADRENSVDEVAGIDMHGVDPEIAKVVLDISHKGAIHASLNLGEQILRQLARNGPLHKKRVQQASFRVLTAPNMPSVLVETGFITNPGEEQKLRTGQHQQRIAEAILAGVKQYLEHKAPPGTLLATRTHVIRRGDTLSEIARFYGVKVKSLRVLNGLRGDLIRVGQKLRIPTIRDS